MSARNSQLVRYGVVALVAVALLLAAAGYTAGRLSAAPSASPPLRVTVLNPTCTGINATSTFSKIGNIGTFEVQAADSLVETAFHGRLYAASTNGTGVIFELRVDDAPSTVGRIRGILKSAELGGSVGRAVSMAGFFEGLAPGTHTVSMWAQVANGNTASTVMYDNGCWSSDHVVIKEYLPFGSVALPAVLGQ